MPGPDPFAPLPPELQTGPLAVPLSMPNQFGGVAAGNPFDVTGQAQAQAAAAEAARRSVLPPVQPIPLPPHSAAIPPVEPAFDPAAAPLPPPVLPSPDPSAYNSFPPTVPSAAPVPGAPTAAAPAPAHGASAGAGPGMVQQFDKDINKLQASEQAAAADLADAQKDAAFAEGGAYHDKAVQAEMAAQERADLAKSVADRSAKLDAIDAANLKAAQDYTIPDFWKDKTGKLVGSTIAVALSGIGAGLLGSTQNTALQAIQHNIDQYFHRQKEKVDNLYRYAAETGKLNAQTKLRYAQELLDLKDQHSLVLQAASDRVNAVGTEAKGAADAAKTRFLATQLGEQAIKDKQDVRELRSKMMLQEAQAEAARGSAAESRARAAQGGYLTPAQQFTQAQGIVRDLDTQYRYVTDPKTGVAAHQRELGGKLKAINESPNNPANWVALIDSAIKTNTGKAAIMSQYNLYMGHAAGANDNVDQILAKFQTGLPSKQQQAAILGAAKQGYNELRSIGAEANKNYHAAVEGNPAIESNPAAKAMVRMHERNVFGSLAGYGGTEPDLGAAAAPAPAAASQPKQLKDKTGKIWTLQPDGQYR